MSLLYLQMHERIGFLHFYFHPGLSFVSFLLNALHLRLFLLENDLNYSIMLRSLVKVALKRTNIQEECSLCRNRRKFDRKNLDFILFLKFFPTLPSSHHYINNIMLFILLNPFMYFRIAIYLKLELIISLVIVEIL